MEKIQKVDSYIGNAGELISEQQFQRNLSITKKFSSGPFNVKKSFLTEKTQKHRCDFFGSFRSNWFDSLGSKNAFSLLKKINKLK